MLTLHLFMTQHLCLEFKVRALWGCHENAFMLAKMWLGFFGVFFVFLLFVISSTKYAVTSFYYNKKTEVEDKFTALNKVN